MSNSMNSEMQYGRIRGIEKLVSRVVMGTFGRMTAVSSALFDDFFERGGTCFDTAHIYGDGGCERVLGGWITQRDLREEVVILGKGAREPLSTPTDVTWQLEESLHRLQTDYIDLYMLHRDIPQIPVGEFISLLDEHEKAGRIRAYGASNWTLPRIQEAQDYAREHGLTGFTAISNQFSLAQMLEPPVEGCVSAWDVDTRDWLSHTQTPLMPWSSQAGGFFAGQVDPGNIHCWDSSDNSARLQRATVFGSARGLPATTIALAYVLCQPFPTLPLIGPRTPAETHTSLLALDVHLTREECEWLEGQLDDRAL